ncbi:MAG: response regulator, partial [Gemmataceae bacterium]
LVRRLVEQHGGRVEAHSDGEGRGSEFVIRLPIHVVEEPGSGEMPALPAFTPPPFIPIRRRIVLVEDMADAREMLKELLEMVGHDVHTAGDGLSGLELIRTVKPDLGLIDVGLPRLDGHEVARRLRSEPGKQASLYLVAMTGYSQPRDRQLALEAGFNDHLVKPVQLEDLMRAIDRAGALTGKSN